MSLGAVPSLSRSRLLSPFPRSTPTGAVLIVTDNGLCLRGDPHAECESGRSQQLYTRRKQPAQHIETHKQTSRKTPTMEEGLVGHGTAAQTGLVTVREVQKCEERNGSAAFRQCSSSSGRLEGRGASPGPPPSCLQG
ncbi:hypothetical protein CMUS01_09048 [Colletotrichum musicola]|uniref:Uncharacterized protein n=1 Tax=Colletotrichum musicola TaxID=2175873 RepID=A0A8H6K9L6_9PEZI|nr:hypothetical protein CMUS01_09048 [Colletotrichum musicola]